MPLPGATPLLGPSSPVLLAIGDSHAKFWSGHNTQRKVGRPRLPHVDVLHMGPVTAHNVNNPDATTGGKSRLIAKLQARTRRFDALIVSMGEIDCRAHLIQAAIRRNVSIEAATEDTVRRYFDFIDWLRDAYDRPILVWGPGPTSPAGVTKVNHAFPLVGAALERNYATLLFNEAAERRCGDRPGVGFATLFHDLIGPDGMTLPSALYDSIHVSNRHLAAGIAKAGAAFEAMGLGALSAAFSPWALRLDYHVRNVAAGLTVDAADPSRPVAAHPLPDAPGSTLAIDGGTSGGGITLDLGAAYPVKTVELHGPGAGTSDWHVSMGAAITGAEESFLPLSPVPDALAADRAVFRPTGQTPLRVLRITPTGAPLRLATIRVLGRSFVPRAGLA